MRKIMQKSSKIMQKMRQGDQFQTSFCFFLKKLDMSQKQVVCSLIDPLLFWKGPMNQGLSTCPSVLPFFCPSVVLSKSILGISSLVFPETQHSVRGPCVVVRGRAGLFEGKCFVPKMGKVGQK